MEEITGDHTYTHASSTSRRKMLALGGLAAAAGAYGALSVTPAHAADPVISVNTLTGDVVLTASDVGALPIDYFAGTVITVTQDVYPNGAADSAPGLQAAIDELPNAGGTLIIPPGVYLLGSGLNASAVGGIEGVRSVTFYAPHGQAVFRRHTFTGAPANKSPMITASGRFSSPITVNNLSTGTTTETGFEVGTTSLTLASTPPSDWNRGDLVRVISDEPIPGGRIEGSKFPRLGEYFRVLSKNGNTLVLNGHPIESFGAANVRVAKLESTNTLRVVGLGFDVSDTIITNGTSADGVINCIGLRAPMLDSVRVEKAIGAILRMAACVGYRIDNVSINWGVNNAHVTPNLQSYGVHDAGSVGGLVLGGTIRFVRHGYADKSFDTAANDPSPWKYGRTFFTRVIGLEVIEPSTAAFDTHQESWGVQFLGCIARLSSAAAGFNIRGYAHVVSDCQVYGGSAAIDVYAEGAGPSTKTREIVCTNLRSYDCATVINVDINNRDKSHVDYGKRDTVHNLTVDGVIARGARCLIAVDNAQISVANVHVRAADTVIPRFIAISNSVVDLTNIAIDLTGTTTVSSGNPARIVMVEAAAEATVDPASSVTIRGLTVTASTAYASRATAGPFMTDSTTEIHWTDVLLDRAYPNAPGQIANTDRCTFGWRTVSANTATTIADMASSASVALVDAALADTSSLTRSPDANLLLVASISMNRTLGPLGRARYLGQRLSILVTGSGGQLTVNSGSAHGTYLPTHPNAAIVAPNGQLHLFWAGSNWRQVV